MFWSCSTCGRTGIRQRVQVPWWLIELICVIQDSIFSLLNFFSWLFQSRSVAAMVPVPFLRISCRIPTLSLLVLLKDLSLTVNFVVTALQVIDDTLPGRIAR